MFQPRRPGLWRWVGDALLDGKIPPGKTTLRIAVLRRLLELGANATDEELELELQHFARGGRKRGLG